ncbi:MAG: hypothetical protein ACXW4L_09345, partial [Candidatus Limnocylindrales bacterium]
MTERHDGSTIDLEEQLIRYLVRERLTRRDLLERIARVGAAAALAPVIAACTSSGTTAAPSASSSPTAAASSGPTA